MNKHALFLLRGSRVGGIGNNLVSILGDTVKSKSLKSPWMSTASAIWRKRQEKLQIMAKCFIMIVEKNHKLADESGGCEIDTKAYHCLLRFQ